MFVWAAMVVWSWEDNALDVEGKSEEHSSGFEETTQQERQMD